MESRDGFFVGKDGAGVVLDCDAIEKSPSPWPSPRSTGAREQEPRLLLRGAGETLVKIRRYIYYLQVLQHVTSTNSLFIASSGMLAMRMTRSVVGLLVLVIGGQTVWGDESAKGNDSLVAYLPAGAIGTLEVSQLAPLIERIETSPALQMVLNSPQWREAIKQEPVQKALAGKALAEGQLGMSLWQFAKTYFGDRVVLGVYPPSQPGTPPDGVVIVRVNEAEQLTRLWERLSPLLPLAGDKLKVGEYPGGGRLITFEDGHQAVIRDRWIVLTKVKPLLENTLKNLSTPTSTGLLETLAWKQMTAQLGSRHHVQLCVNLAGLTELSGHRFIPAKLDNPVISLLLGGYLELAAGSPYLGSTLDILENHFELRSTVAGDPKTLDAAHQSFIAGTETAGRAEVPALKTPLNGFSLTRDFASWYRHRESLLEAKLLPGFDKFETGLAVFLAGRDFSEDVLPTLGQRVTVVTTPQSFSHLKGKPGVQLPGIAVLFDLAKPTEANDLLNLVFQTIVLVSNLQASQEGRQTFVLSSETYRETQVAYAKYVKQSDEAALPISYNFQPASARVGNRYVFASSLETCRQLIDSIQDETTSPRVSPSVPPDGTRDLFLDISPAVAADLLELNAPVLQAQNLQQGKSVEQSTQELETLFKFLRQLTPLTFTSTRFSDRWVLEFRGGWK